MNFKSRKLLCAAVCFSCASAALLAAGNVGEHVASKKIQP